MKKTEIINNLFNLLENNMQLFEDDELKKELKAFIVNREGKDIKTLRVKLGKIDRKFNGEIKRVLGKKELINTFLGTSTGDKFKEKTKKSGGKKKKKEEKSLLKSIGKVKINLEKLENEINGYETIEGNNNVFENEINKNEYLFDIGNFNFYVTTKEYKILTNTYMQFLRNFSNNDGSGFFEKTIAVLFSEIVFICNTFDIDYDKFLNDIGAGVVLLGETRKIIEKSRKKIKPKKNIQFSKFLELEINKKESDKINTEIALKYLLFYGDFNAITQLFLNKLNGILFNTNLKVIFDEKFQKEDLESSIIFEVIKGLKTYRKKLIDGPGHTTKIMSYSDRIIRNVVGTSNQKISQNQEIIGVYCNGDDGEGENIVEYFSGTEEINKDSFFISFDDWGYLLRYINSEHSSLLNNYIRNFHFFKIDTLNFNFISNLQGYYFFDKIVKDYDFYGKMITSYFDLVVFLKKHSDLTGKEIYNELFQDGTLKFGILGLSGENTNKLIIYNNSKKKIEDFFDKHKDGKELFDKYKKMIKTLIALIFEGKTYGGLKKVKAFGDLYRNIRIFEKIFIDNFYEKVFEEHNLKLLKKIIDVFQKDLKDTYNNEIETSTTIYNLIKGIRKKTSKYKNIFKSKMFTKQNVFNRKKTSKMKNIFTLTRLYGNKKSINSLINEKDNVFKKIDFFGGLYDEVFNEGQVMGLESINKNIHISEQFQKE